MTRKLLTARARKLQAQRARRRDPSLAGLLKYAADDILAFAMVEESNKDEPDDQDHDRLCVLARAGAARLVARQRERHKRLMKTHRPDGGTR